MNKVFLVGNLVADPILKQTFAKKSMVVFTIAINEWQNKTQKTIFLSCKAWDKKADYIGQYIKKGNLVAIEGKLDRRSFVNKTGSNVYVTEIIVEDIKSFNPKKPSNQSNDEELVSVDKNFNTQVVDQQTNFSQPESNESQTNNNDDLKDLEWINDDGEKNE